MSEFNDYLFIAILATLAAKLVVLARITEVVIKILERLKND